MADIRVEQKPVDVIFDCDGCEEEIRISYGEFTALHGEPCDWNYETVVCLRCGYENKVDNWEFD